ncbi:MAG: hypothetical protein WBX25_00485 [Rhodomicrobium sp.]
MGIGGRERRTFRLSAEMSLAKVEARVVVSRLSQTSYWPLAMAQFFLKAIQTAPRAQKAGDRLGDG